MMVYNIYLLVTLLIVLKFNISGVFTDDERMWAALSFVIILIIIGVPLWWKMTEVERSYFPYTEIADLRDQNVSFPFTISICTENIDAAHKMKNNLEQYFKNSGYLSCRCIFDDLDQLY